MRHGLVGWWRPQTEGDQAGGRHQCRMSILISSIRSCNDGFNMVQHVSTCFNMFQHIISTHNFDIFQPWEAGQCLVSHPWMKRNHFYQIFLGFWTTYGSTVGWTLSAMVHLLQENYVVWGPGVVFFKSLSILFLFAKIDHIFGVDTCSHGLPITCLEQKELRGFQGTCPAERASAGLDRHRKYLQQSGERVDNPWFKQLLFRPHELRLQLENYFCRIRSPVHLSSPKKTVKSHLYIS